MKTLLVILLISSISFADQKYTFKYKLDGEVLEIEKKDVSWEKAFSFAAEECFKFFKKHKYLTEEKGLDIIDVCANPR